MCTWHFHKSSSLWHRPACPPPTTHVPFKLEAVSFSFAQAPTDLQASTAALVVWQLNGLWWPGVELAREVRLAKLGTYFTKQVQGITNIKIILLAVTNQAGLGLYFSGMTDLEINTCCFMNFVESWETSFFFFFWSGLILFRKN